MQEAGTSECVSVSLLLCQFVGRTVCRFAGRPVGLVGRFAESRGRGISVIVGRIRSMNINPRAQHTRSSTHAARAALHTHRALKCEPGEISIQNVAEVGEGGGGARFTSNR